MAMTISSSSTLSAQNSLSKTQSSLASSLEKLSSGKKVNHAQDDAAATAIIQQFAAQVSGSNQAVRNLNDSVSMVQVADGAASQLTSNTQRLRELAVSAANGTLSTSDRSAIQEEANQLSQANADIVQNTQFNGNAVFQGGTQTIQAGANAGDTINIDATGLASDTGSSGLYSVTGQVDLTTAAGASAALGQLDSDLQQISSTQASYGAAQSRIEASIANASTTAINTAAAQSRMEDTDYASQTSTFTLEKIKNQAALAMEAHANANSKQVLSLLQA